MQKNLLARLKEAIEYDAKYGVSEAVLIEAADRIRSLEADLRLIATHYENASEYVTVGERANQAYDFRCIARRALGEES